MNDEDDGRVIADMSYTDQPSDDLPDLGREGRFAVVRGALGASMLIGAIYVVAAAGIIGLMLLIWNL